MLRYCARPPFATDRIEVLKDGRVAYLIESARRGSTRRVMTPIEFMARLAALIPPPFYPTITYHGVFAGRSTWRALVTPKARAARGTRRRRRVTTQRRTRKRRSASTPRRQSRRRRKLRRRPPRRCFRRRPTS
ncbi:transposase [Sorangium sp. So ce375]